MYVMFVATGDSDSKVHLVEWRSAERQIKDLEEEFQKALDHYSQKKPHMGNWSMVMGLTVHGNKIVTVENKPHEPNPLTDFRNKRIMAALKYNEV